MVRYVSLRGMPHKDCEMVLKPFNVIFLITTMKIISQKQKCFLCGRFYESATNEIRN